MRTTICAIATCLLFLFVASCAALPRQDVVAVSSVMPVLNVPEKPQMDLLTSDEVLEYSKLSPGLRAKLERNNEKLKEYAMQLKVTLETYDDFAKTHNANGSGIQLSAIPTAKGKK